MENTENQVVIVNFDNYKDIKVGQKAILLELSPEDECHKHAEVLKDQLALIENKTEMIYQGFGDWNVGYHKYDTGEEEQNRICHFAFDYKIQYIKSQNKCN